MISPRFTKLCYGLKHPWAARGIWACAVTLIAFACVSFRWWEYDRQYKLAMLRVVNTRSDIVKVHKSELLLAAYSDARQQIDVLGRKLEYAATQAQLVQDIDELARNNGVMVLTQSYEDNHSANGRAAFLTELSIQCNYQAFRSFLADLSTLPSWTEAREVVVERGSDDKIIKGRIELITYRLNMAHRDKS